MEVNDSVLDSISPFVRFGGEFRDGPDLAMGSRFLYDHLLEYVAEGRVEYTIDGSSYKLEPGHVVLIPPRSVHTIRARSSAIVVRQSIHFDFVFEGGYATMPAWEWHPNPMHSRAVHDGQRFLDALGLQTVTDLSAYPRVGALFSRILAEVYHAQTGYQVAVKASMLEIILLLHRAAHATVPRDDRFSQLPKPVAEAKRYIDTYYAHHLTLGSIAAVAHYHRVHLERLFKRHIGMTVMNYLASVRIRKAKALLRDANFSIAGVGEAVGYGSPQHFSSMFRETTGVSPRQYRKEAREAGPQGADRNQARSMGDYPMYEVIYDRLHCRKSLIDKGMGRSLADDSAQDDPA